MDSKLMLVRWYTSANLGDRIQNTENEFDLQFRIPEVSRSYLKVPPEVALEEHVVTDFSETPI